MTFSPKTNNARVYLKLDRDHLLQTVSVGSFLSHVGFDHDSILCLPETVSLFHSLSCLCHVTVSVSQR